MLAVRECRDQSVVSILSAAHRVNARASPGADTQVRRLL